MSWSCCKCFKAESTDIKQLNYEHYTLHDVPTEVFVFERTLEELHLDSNRIRDLPRPLFHCHGLKVLSLRDNEVYSLPPAIASLINLQHLDISRNALNSIPDNLKGCKHLTYVDVSMNPLEKLPEGFTQLISLEELYLNDTYLDFLPANFGRLMRLRILELRENNLNTLPKSIARLLHLQRLDIGQNDFSDVPEVIGNLPNITELWIDSNRIRSIPTFIGNLKKLVHLEASNNNIQFISAEIEHCGKIVDCSLTCNELKSLPETIGNLKELITLKIDENQLSSLPNTIGNLSNLEELILSQNDLDSIPASIGLLRKLHILNVDDNMLEELPPEIGSCTRLRILSAHSNKLQHVPAELGHLSNLHVINLSENQLQNLPVSILNLGQLKALWLSNNQSTPLTTLQQEIDKHTGQMVCTNFMLPQCSQKANLTENNWMLQGMCPVTSNKSKQHISFASDADAGAPSRLMRAPTPYPKELRAMAKHARAMHHMKKSKGIEDDLHVMEEMVSQEPKDVLIKEAKVKKPSIDTVIVQASEQYGSVKDDNIIEKQLESMRDLDSNSILQVYDHLTYSSSLGEASSTIVLGTGPVVREAKYVRNINTPHYDNIYWTSEDRRKENIVPNPEQTNQHPPPYHIAAAYSKQAAYFLQSNSMPPHRICNYNGEKSSCSPSRRFSDQEIMEPMDLDARLNVCQEDATERPQEKPINSDNVIKSHEEQAVNNFSECSFLPEETPTEENISNEVSFLSSPLCKQIITAESQNVNLYKSDTHFSEIRNSVIVSNDDNQRKMENFGEKIIGNGKVEGENIFLNVSCKLIDQTECERTEEHGNDIPHLQKPQTFTQDKPSVSGSVIAPTPQRPLSTNTSPDNKMPLLMTEYSHLCEPREFSQVPHFVSLSKLLNPEEIQNENNELNCLNKVFPAINERRTLELSANSSSSRTHSSLILSPKQEISDFQNYIPSLSSSTSTAPINAVTESESDFFDPVPSKSVNSYINSQCKSSGLMTNALNSENNLSVDLQYLRNSIAKSEILDLECVLESSSKVDDPLPESKVYDILSADQQSKTQSKWMFGLHKNATVFPVTIQKNSGLGFSISGGIKAMNNCERYENEIIVTKVHPNGPASKTIMPGDKILEVDGIDFTKLEHDEAVKVLKQTGNVVSMMISRQQL